MCVYLYISVFYIIYVYIRVDSNVHSLSLPHSGGPSILSHAYGLPVLMLAEVYTARIEACGYVCMHIDIYYRFTHMDINRYDPTNIYPLVSARAVLRRGSPGSGPWNFAIKDTMFGHRGSLSCGSLEFKSNANEK